MTTSNPQSAVRNRRLGVIGTFVWDTLTGATRVRFPWRNGAASRTR